MRVLGIHPSHDASIAIVNDGRLEYFCKEERVSRVKHDELHWCDRNSNNGHTWGMEDMRVLGISPAHDASVAIVQDGQVEYFCKEERLSRVKHDRHHSPLTSQENFLPWSFVKIIDDIGSIDYVVISSPTWYVEINDTIIELTKENSLLEIFLQETFGAHGAEVSRRDKFHHEAHASLAFNNSGFESALIAVIDRQGSDVNGNMREAETIFKADLDYNFEPIHKTYWAYNIGEKFDLDIYNDIITLKKHWPDCEIVCESTLGITKVYETATTLIGQHSLENGKVMGLAAYGTDKKFKDLFVIGIPNTNKSLNFLSVP
jgi:predicted NodU family carbamoyl transferase